MSDVEKTVAYERATLMLHGRANPVVETLPQLFTSAAEFQLSSMAQPMQLESSITTSREGEPGETKTFS